MPSKYFKKETLQRTIQDFLIEFGRPTNPETISKLHRWRPSKRKVVAALVQLHKKGRIVRVERGIYAHPPFAHRPAHRPTLLKRLWHTIAQHDGFTLLMAYDAFCPEYFHRTVYRAMFQLFHAEKIVRKKGTDLFFALDERGKCIRGERRIRKHARHLKEPRAAARREVLTVLKSFAKPMRAKEVWCHLPERHQDNRTKAYVASTLLSLYKSGYIQRVRRGVYLATPDRERIGVTKTKKQELLEFLLERDVVPTKEIMAHFEGRSSSAIYTDLKRLMQEGVVFQDSDTLGYMACREEDIDKKPRIRRKRSKDWKPQTDISKFDDPSGKAPPKYNHNK